MTGGTGDTARGGVREVAGVFLRLGTIADKLRSSPWTSAMLDGVNATGLALMAGVSGQLATDALVDALTVAVFLVTLVLLWRTRLNSAWYIAGGALVGLVAGITG